MEHESAEPEMHPWMKAYIAVMEGRRLPEGRRRPAPLVGHTLLNRLPLSDGRHGLTLAEFPTVRLPAEMINGRSTGTVPAWLLHDIAYARGDVVKLYQLREVGTLPRLLSPREWGGF
jgi:hypothetical protein